MMVESQNGILYGNDIEQTTTNYNTKESHKRCLE